MLVIKAVRLSLRPRVAITWPGTETSESRGTPFTLFRLQFLKYRNRCHAMSVYSKISFNLNRQPIKHRIVLPACSNRTCLGVASLFPPYVANANVEVIQARLRIYSTMARVRCVWAQANREANAQLRPIQRRVIMLPVLVVPCLSRFLWRSSIVTQRSISPGQAHP